MGRDEQRAVAPAEVLLEPLDRADVEVVRRLVEQQQVRLGDHEPGERRPGLLAAGQRRRRLRPLVAGEPEAGQRLVDPQVERVAAEDLELVLEVRVGRLLDATGAPRARPGATPIASRCAAPWRTAARRSGDAMNAASKCDSWASRPIVSPRLRWTAPPSGSSRPGGDPEQRRLAGAVRPDEPDPVVDRDRGGDLVEDDERARPRGGRARGGGSTSAQPADRGPGGRAPGGRGPPRPLGPRRSATRAAAPASPARPDAPLPARQLRPAPARGRRPARTSSGGSPARPARSAGGQALAPRAEVGRPAADDDPPDRPAAAAARLAGPLVDLEVLLHLAVAVGRRVVVDRRAAPDHRLGEDPPDLDPEPPLVGRAERPGRPERMEARRPERLVGVDVADAGDERLVQQQRLEPALPGAEPAPERLAP